MSISLDQPQQIHGGWRVVETEHYWVDVLVMMYGNTRIVLTPKANPLEYTRGWCYQDGLTATLLRCTMFDPEAGEEPAGWVKEVGTERRACAAYHRGARLHRGYDPDCSDCGNEALAS